jgi:hypothetical protein
MQAGAAQADTHDLLVAYFSVLDLVAGPVRAHAVARRLLGPLKPTVGIETYLVEHMRANLERFDRRYRLRLALGQDTDDDERDCDALADFLASLSPRRTRLWILLPYLAGLVVTQIFISAVARTSDITDLHELAGVLSLNPQVISTSVDNLVRYDNHKHVLGVLLAGSISLWLAFRPFMWGFHVKRVLLNEPHSMGRRKRRTKQAEIARELDVRGREERLCLRLGMLPPLDSPLDLVIQATIMVAWIIVGATLAIESYSQTESLCVGTGLVALAVIRLAWLARRARQRASFREPTLVASAPQIIHARSKEARA